MKALKTHEWIQRKMIRRLTTPDLMFGQMVAPPPVGVANISESISINDVLNCFTTKGIPTNSDLSPIAMRDASQVTRVHDPALSDVSYNMIISSTPSSKKQYHGVHYCLTNEDSSKDSKWTKIQQRCLISERAGHCSNVSTPRAERSQRESRRLKEVQQLQNKKQQKLKENEEQKRKDADGGRGEEEGERVSEEKENKGEGGGDERGGERRESGKLSSASKSGDGVMFKSRRSLQFTRSDVRTVKSPTVKITRISSRQRQTSFSKRLKLVDKQKAAGAIQNGTKSTTAPTFALQSTAAANQGGVVFDEGREIVKSPTKNKTSLETISETEDSERNDTLVGHEVGDDLPVVMECSSSVMAPPLSPANGGSSSSPLRRSPRLKSKYKPTNTGRATDSSSSRQSDGRKRKSDTERKKEKSVKAQFGPIVVGVLKKNGVSRDHPSFKQYYTQLYNVSKDFLNDLKQLTGRKVVTEEMKRVVQMNVGRVVSSESTMS